MATKAVTLKNSNDDTVYPVTDISLVNGGIFADTIAPVEAGEQVETAMIADGAVTSSKLDWSSMPAPILVTVPSHVTKSLTSWGTTEFYTTNVNFQAGKYLVFFVAAMGGTATNGEHWARAALDDITSATHSVGNEWQFGQGMMQTVSSFDVWDITAGVHAVKFGAGVETSGSITMYGNGATRVLFVKVG